MFPQPATYFDRLREHLRLDDSVESDVVRELQSHVEDSVDRLVHGGVPEHDARARVIGRMGRPQTLAHLMRRAHLVTPWPEALAGATPMLLMAALIAGTLWQQPVIALAASVLVVAVTLFGLFQGRPTWFYPWAGVALTMPLVAGYIAFEVLREQIPALASGSASPTVVLGIAGAGLYFPVGLVVVVGAVLVAARRDWLDASVLLSPLPGVFAWIVAVHHAGGIRHANASMAGTAQLLGVAYVCMAFATIVVMRSRSRTTKIATMVVGALALVSLGTPLDSQAALLTVGLRAGLLGVFLLSPALVVHQSLER